MRTFLKMVNDASASDLDASRDEAIFYLQVARSSPCACACLPPLGCARAAALSGYGRGGQAVPHRPRRSRPKRGMYEYVYTCIDIHTHLHTYAPT